MPWLAREHGGNRDGAPRSLVSDRRCGQFATETPTDSGPTGGLRTGRPLFSPGQFLPIRELGVAISGIFSRDLGHQIGPGERYRPRFLPTRKRDSRFRLPGRLILQNDKVPANGRLQRWPTRAPNRQGLGQGRGLGPGDAAIRRVCRSFKPVLARSEASRWAREGLATRPALPEDADLRLPRLSQTCPNRAKPPESLRFAQAARSRAAGGGVRDKRGGACTWRHSRLRVPSCSRRMVGPKRRLSDARAHPRRRGSTEPTGPPSQPGATQRA